MGERSIQGAPKAPLRFPPDPHIRRGALRLKANAQHRPGVGRTHERPAITKVNARAINVEHGVAVAVARPNRLRNADFASSGHGSFNSGDVK